MAMGEGGPELVKQLLSQTYDINMPEVIGIYMTGEPAKGVGPQDVALAIIGEVFDKLAFNSSIVYVLLGWNGIAIIGLILDKST